MIKSNITAISSDLWNDDTDLEISKKGKYIAVSGNTGAGKSTLIRRLTEIGPGYGLPIVGISERVLHHPLLRLMFSRPQDWAFAIQLNFMIQRHMMIKRQLELGHTIVLERSHYDDELFLTEHFKEKKLSQSEYDAYMALANVLHAKVPEPDVMVLLRVTPEISMERILQSEKKGERPVEFPNEEIKNAWVSRWFNLYEEFHDDLRQKIKHEAKLQNTVLIERTATDPTDAIAEAVITSLR